MKKNNLSKILVVAVIFLVSVICTLPSTPIWENAFGSLTADEQTGVPIDRFDYQEESSTHSVLLTISVNKMAEVFNRPKNAPSYEELLDKVSDTIRVKLNSIDNIHAEYTKTDMVEKKATLRVNVENVEKLKTIIANSKLYAKLPLSLAKLFPQKKITLGLDLKGGLDLVYQVDLDSIQEGDSIADAVNRSVEIIRNRIDVFGIAEPSIKAQEGNRIRVQLPGVKDPERVKQLIQNTAMLQFHLVEDQAVNASDLEPVSPTEKLLMSKGGTNQMPMWFKLKRKPDITGSDLRFAKVAFDEMGSPMVHIEFNGNGRLLFGKLTGENVGRQLAIVLDDKVYSAPTIQTRITGGSAQITGKFSLEEATDLATVLKAGALPASLIALESRVVGPTLGQQSIDAGFVAGIIGFVLVMVYMVIFYNTCGIIADVAVIFNSLIVFASLVIFGGTMTLPGIAGFVLSVGMAVDANIIIFERIREEFRSGKTVRAAISSGFDRAFTCILDSNVTTLLVVAILYSFNSGPIRGFATTLGIGLIANLYTAVFFSKLCLEGWFNGHPNRRLGL
ncbi:MAG: protein translocase subunit SecD [Candidatus Riflebacteria bacterium]|nr:protein translocase subunit SecD [Candidatus Riflebacteria bacterium]